MDEFTTVSGHQPLVSKWAQAPTSNASSPTNIDKLSRTAKPASVVKTAPKSADTAVVNAKHALGDGNHRTKLESKWARPTSQPKNSSKPPRSAAPVPKAALEPKKQDIGAGLRACMHNRTAAPPQNPRRNSRRSSDSQSRAFVKPAMKATARDAKPHTAKTNTTRSNTATPHTATPAVPLPAATDFSAWEDLYDPEQSWADAELDYVP